MKKIYFLFLLFCFNTNAQIVNIPDANFKAKLIQQGVDTNSDGQIQQSEALARTSLYLDYSNISSLDGIESFTNLTSLNCDNNNLSVLNVSNLTLLTNLSCRNNQITSLNVLNLSNLYSLSCSSNLLTSLDLSNLVHLYVIYASDGFSGTLTTLNVSGCTALNAIYANYNQLTTLNVSGCTSLYVIYADYNQLTTLNVSGCSALYGVYAGNNQLVTLNASGCSALYAIHASNNQLTTLNVTGCSSLSSIQASYNQLSTLDLSDCSVLSHASLYNNSLNTLFAKNGANETFSLSGNNNLEYICVDESQIIDVQNTVNSNNLTNCQVNSYCSFNPGGIFYTVQGTNKVDSNNNGCDALDTFMPNLKFNITNGTLNGSIISNGLGNYSLPVSAGTHTITPVFENPTYFNVSPTNAVVSFPTESSPFIQNFCITPNGIHPDLEISMLPLVPARPGFDAIYRIIYKNKGNVTQSGTVNLTFNDAVLDLINSNPAVTAQVLNNLSWNFVNLFPFESREITLTLNVNSPVETPAVNIGDVLNYNLTITSPDEAPCDNTNSFTLCDNIFNYNQTVVGSYDPNDKTCLEGNIIAPEKVGDYVHYMIRFENTGTFPAQNVVVKDMIDTAKFDVNSIVPIKGSHSFVTNITAANKVEFIFENINLPFNDANNDG